MKKYGLIGRKLGHSFSPSYFSKKFTDLGIDAQYLAYEFEQINGVQTILDDGINGFNITNPYKVEVMDFLNGLSEDAKTIGAVNCVKNVNGQFIGHNTDWVGFMDSLIDFIGEHRGDALVLGYGGASKGVVYALGKMGINYKIVSRQEGFLSYDDLNDEMISNHSIIINTTSLGMFPHIEGFPLIPYESLTKDHHLYDIVYNPEKTVFLQKGEKMGANIKNGYDMLILQAEESWRIWNDLDK
jgi:shikimate dehydrogenase